MPTLVLTVIGDDRPGLVAALSAPINEYGASWERSRFAHLAGKFAGILEVEVREDRVDDLLAALGSLVDDGLHVTAERTDEPAPATTKQLTLELIGSDRPGIVAEISALLADRGIGIEELSTEVREAPMAGGMLFHAAAVLGAPPTANLHDLRRAIESLADELMVEVELTDD